MRKVERHDIERQKIIDIRNRKKRSASILQRSKFILSKLESRRNFRLKWHAPLPKVLSITNPKFREATLNNIQVLNFRSQSNQPCYLDFFNVELLMPDGAIHLYSTLDKHSKLKVYGRISKTATVRCMLTKLNIHRRLRLSPYNKRDKMVDHWHIVTGDSADLGESYDTIEETLMNMVPNKKARMRLQNAVSEAVTNVVNHAYEATDTYKRWVMFFCVKKDTCAIVISDLGKTIPFTVPIKLKHKLLHLGTFWRDKKDHDLIKIATEWRTSATDQSYRGKGFDDIIKVNSVFDGAQVLIASRNGVWSSIEGGQDFDDRVHGTIVSWVIPVTDKKMALKV